MTSVPDQLKELIQMLKDGFITREQFEEQRDQLLAESKARGSGGPSDTTVLTEVGAYRLLGLIGEGGMGAVYRGRHRSDTIAERQGGDVAVKVMHPQYARNPDYRDRFEREASLGLKLDHPGIVKVHDLVVDGGNLALVMDFVDGRPLSDFIGVAVGPIPWDRAWPLFQKLLEAVGYAHDQGVVHRDIKPENILVSPDGEPHVIDFGIAKDLDSSGTRTGTGMGTVEYMAPEQYTDAKAVDRRADIYSLGMILYEMLAGRLPWDADAPQFEILEQKARKQLMSPSAFCSDIPPEVVAALAPALSGDPQHRPGAVAEFRDGFLPTGGSAPDSPPTPAPLASLSPTVERPPRSTAVPSEVEPGKVSARETTLDRDTVGTAFRTAVVVVAAGVTLALVLLGGAAAWRWLPAGSRSTEPQVRAGGDLVGTEEASPVAMHEERRSTAEETTPAEAAFKPFKLAPPADEAPTRDTVTFFTETPPPPPPPPPPAATRESGATGTEAESGATEEVTPEDVILVDVPPDDVIPEDAPTEDVTPEEMVPGDLPPQDMTPPADYTRKGDELSRKGQYAEAVQAYQKALDANSENPRAHRGLGWAYIEIGSAVQATDHFRRAIVLDSMNAEAHYGLGLAYEQLGRTEQAINEYATYLGLAPNGREATEVRILLRRLQER